MLKVIVSLVFAVALTFAVYHFVPVVAMPVAFANASLSSVPVWLTWEMLLCLAFFIVGYRIVHGKH